MLSEHPSREEHPVEVVGLMLDHLGEESLGGHPEPLPGDVPGGYREGHGTAGDAAHAGQAQASLVGIAFSVLVRYPGVDEGDWSIQRAELDHRDPLGVSDLVGGESDPVGFPHRLDHLPDELPGLLGYLADLLGRAEERGVWGLATVAPDGV